MSGGKLKSNTQCSSPMENWKLGASQVSRIGKENPTLLPETPLLKSMEVDSHVCILNTSLRKSKNSEKCSPSVFTYKMDCVFFWYQSFLSFIDLVQFALKRSIKQHRLHTGHTVGGSSVRLR